MESGIHYAAIYQDEDGCEFNEALFRKFPDVYTALTEDEILKDVIRVYDFGEKGAILYSELKNNECFLGVV